MCRVGIAALICATAVVGPLMAQDNVSTRTKTLLAAPSLQGHTTSSIGPTTATKWLTSSPPQPNKLWIA